METTTTNQPKKGEFFHLQPDVRRGGKGHGVVFENRDALLTPPRLILKPKDGGFPALREIHAWSTTPVKACFPKIWKGDSAATGWCQSACVE